MGLDTAVRAVLAIGLLLVAQCPCVMAARPSVFDLEGHRGARGLAPENTLAAFRRALEIGVTTLETDVVITRDLVPVISHDPLLNPDLVRDPMGRWLQQPGPPIHALTLSELKRYDIGRINPESRYARSFPAQRPADGERFPTLAEVLQLAKEGGRRVRVSLETKITPDNAGETVDPATFVRLIVGAVDAAGMRDRVILQSFDWRTLLAAKALAPDIPRSCLTIEAADMNTVAAGPEGRSPWHGGLRLADHDSLPALVHAAGCTIWSPFHRNVTAPAIARAHELGLTVVAWTVNDPADMRRLIGLEVDGLISDYPDRLREVLKESAIPLP